MSHEVLHPKNWKAARGYANGIAARGRTVFCGGLVGWNGDVKLADFGIARVTGVRADTQNGLIQGTFGYMAPEQVNGADVGTHTDVYAAGLLLWEMLAHRKAIQRGVLPEIEIPTLELERLHHGLATREREDDRGTRRSRDGGSSGSRPCPG